MEQLDILFKYALQNGWSPLRNEPMALHTTFKIGGPADLMIEILSERELCMAIRKCRELGVPYYCIGKGSNLLVPDEGIRGCVFTMGGELVQVKKLGNGRLWGGAGASLARLCAYALSEELSGLEFAWGIPGSVGGAAFMNAGAYGGEMKNVLVSCRHITPDGDIGELYGEQLNLGYRHSAYAENGCVIIGAAVQLKPDSAVEIRAQMDDYMNRRKSKQPLEYPSAGSVFKRPVGNYAGTLIEKCGLKGYSIGGAQVSEKHAGFIINTGNATCRDVEDLIAHIQKTVFENEGVALECEIKTMGKEVH